MVNCTYESSLKLRGLAAHRRVFHSGVGPRLQLARREHPVDGDTDEVHHGSHEEHLTPLGDSLVLLVLQLKKTVLSSYSIAFFTSIIS